MVNQFKHTIYDCEEQARGFFCQYRSDLNSQGQIRGTAVLDSYSYSYAPHKWIGWVGIALAIVLAHRILGYGLLVWRVNRS